MDTMYSFVVGFFKRETAKPVLILFYTIVALIVWKAIPLNPPFVSGTAEPSTGELSLTGFLWGEQRIWGAFLLMGIFPAFLIRFVFKEKLSDYGLSLGIPLRTFRTMLMAVPPFALAGYLCSRGDSLLITQPFCSCHPFEGWYVWAHLFCYFFLYYFSWEFFFRGFLLYGLAPQCGLAPAVLIQTMAATMLHFGHAESEIIACIFGSLFWAFISLRTKSIVSGSVQHGIMGVLVDYFVTARFL